MHKTHAIPLPRGTWALATLLVLGGCTSSRLADEVRPLRSPAAPPAIEARAPAAVPPPSVELLRAAPGARLRAPAPAAAVPVPRSRTVTPGVAVPVARPAPAKVVNDVHDLLRCAPRPPPVPVPSGCSGGT